MSNNQDDNFSIFVALMVKLSDIKPNPENPRVVKDEQFKKLVQSIKDFPKMMALRPLVVDKDSTVLGGNMRLRALEELGYKEIPNAWVKNAGDLTEEEKREFIIKDNIGYGEWEWEMLRESYDDEKLEEWGLDVPVYEEDPEEAPARDDSESFNDSGIESKSQYGVIVMCESEGNQESVYSSLTNMGYKCKVVVV